MEMNKKELFRLIRESQSMEVDEMAQLQTRKGKPIGKRVIIKYQNKVYIGWKDEVSVKQKPIEGAVVIGWMINEEPVLFTNGNEIAEFIRENPEEYQALKEKYGANLRWTNKKATNYQPRPTEPIKTQPVPDVEGGEEKSFNVAYVPTGAKQSEQETIKRIFNPIIEAEFGDTSEGKRFTQVLAKRSIPEIKAVDRPYLDKYTPTWTNDRIEFRAHTYNSYKSAEDFLKSVLARIKGVETPEMSTYYLARQFNKVYRNWEEDKKNQERYLGKTPKYELDALGLSQIKLDVSLKMVFEITGEKRGDTFIWKISMRNKFGRKSPEEYSINTRLKDVDYSVQLKEGGILDDRSVGVTKTVQLDPEEPVNEQKTIMSQLPVQLGLKEAIKDFKNLIESISPNSALRIANIRQYDVKKGLDESKTNFLFNKLMKKFKK
jgi:hypothetical protein